METLNLSVADRERIDLLLKELGKLGKPVVVLVSCKEAARLLGKSCKTISAMINDGRLRKTTIGCSTGILLSEILEIKPAVMR